MDLSTVCIHKVAKAELIEDVSASVLWTTIKLIGEDGSEINIHLFPAVDKHVTFTTKTNK